jgi:hypothetical protein
METASNPNLSGLSLRWLRIGNHKLGILVWDPQLATPLFLSPHDILKKKIQKIHRN